MPQGDEVIPVANQLQQKFPLVVATQDWHPANHLSFAPNHPGKKPFDRIELEGLPQTLWPVHCVQHTPGAEFAPGLNRRSIAAVFQKGTDPAIDSYSGFYDNGQRRSTGMGEWLLQREVSELFLCGLTTDYCVKFSALDALRFGFKTTVVEDACRGVNLNPDDGARAFEELRAAGVTITKSHRL